MGYLNHIFYSHYYPVTFLTWMSSKVYSLRSKHFQSSYCTNIVEKGKKGNKAKEGWVGGENRKRFSPLPPPSFLVFALVPTFSTNCTYNYILSKQENFSCMSCDSKMPAGQQNHGHYYFIIVIILTTSIYYATNYDSSVFTTGLFTWR